MKKTIFFLILLITLFFVGCEGVVKYDGIIYDINTNEPIDSVQCIIVGFEDRNLYTISDSLGGYSVSTPLVGCVPKCREYEVEFSKNGYKTKIINAPNDVFLEKE